MGKVLYRGVVHAASNIEVVEENLNWTIFKLADGSVLRLKPVLKDVVKLDGVADSRGNPVKLYFWDVIDSVRAVDAEPINGVEPIEFRFHGKLQKGVPVVITSQEGQPSFFKLADGGSVKLEVTLREVYRVNDLLTDAGLPIYSWFRKVTFS